MKKRFKWRVVLFALMLAVYGIFPAVLMSDVSGAETPYNQEVCKKIYNQEIIKENLINSEEPTFNLKPSERPARLGSISKVKGKAGKTLKITISSGKNKKVVKVPKYQGSPYVKVNKNVPFFANKEKTNSSFEKYANLDLYGRCGETYACVGKDLMPTTKRGEIGSVKPSGWHTVKYNGVVEGNYLYNRCHLIGWQLTGENANTRNLITGTRYLNIQGMLPFENMVADYVKETNNHVLYRVNPVFCGTELVARGVLMEAESVEDKGKGIKFCVFCYNVQPGIEIDYATGESRLSGNAPADTQKPTAKPTPKPSQKPETAVEKTVYTTATGKRYHSTSGCRGLNNAKAVYETDENSAKEKGLTKCLICW